MPESTPYKIGKITRRTFITGAIGTAAYLAGKNRLFDSLQTPPSSFETPPLPIPGAPKVSVGITPTQSEAPKQGSETLRLLSHQDFLNTFPIENAAERDALDRTKEQLLRVGRSTVLDAATDKVISLTKTSYPAGTAYWIYPGGGKDANGKPVYEYGAMYSRDSFYVAAALKDKNLLESIQKSFHAEQKSSLDGHIATVLIKTPKEVVRGKDKHEDSTFYDILREYEYFKQGGTPDFVSLGGSREYITRWGAKYITKGEENDPATRGGFHEAFDSYKVTSPQNFAYNQGLYCVAMEALKRMGMQVDIPLLENAKKIYANMVNPKDGKSLPQREGSSIVDVSALTGEALNLYYFGEAILPPERVKATFEQLVMHAAYNVGGKFLGFRNITNFDGSFLSPSDFIDPGKNEPGNYQDGGSWFWFDTLALYAAGRHGIKEAGRLLKERVLTEHERTGTANEFLNTNPNKPPITYAHPDYGADAFAVNLIP